MSRSCFGSRFRFALTVLFCGALLPSVAHGDLLVSVSQSTIQRYDGATGASLGSLPPFGQLHGTTVGSDGSLHVCVGGGVLRYNLATQTIIETWAPPPTGGSCFFSSNVQEIVFGPDGQAFVSDCGSNRLSRLDGETGACLDFLTTACPTGLTFGSDGFLYVTSNNGNRVDRVDPETLVPTTLVTGLAAPWGIAARDGLLYVSNSVTQEVRRYDESTGAFVDVFATAPFVCRGMTFGPSGQLYVATAGGVYRFGSSGAPLGLFAAGGLDCTNVTFSCEVTAGVDCNGNGTSDDCDIESQSSSDCNRNGIPDECESGGFETELVASDGTANDRFGTAIDLSGVHLAVGAPFGEGFGSETGEGYLARRTTSGWSEVARVKGSDSVAGDLFGTSAAIDDHEAIFGAPGTSTGAAYVYRQLASGWVQQQKLTAFDGGAGDGFGLALSLSRDLAVIGAPNQASSAGAAYIFARNAAGIWSEEAKLVPSDSAPLQLFGASVGIDGDLAVVGARGDAGSRGSVYLFRRLAPGVWVEEEKLLASDGVLNDRLGSSVAVEGDLVAAGAPGQSSVNPEAGAVYVFRISSGSWSEAGKITAADSTSNAHFGLQVDVRGRRVLVGAPEQDDGGAEVGAAYFFQDYGGVWDEIQKFSASDAAPNSNFGSALSVGSDGVVAIGASNDDSANLNAGSVYTYFFALDCDGDGVLDSCEIDCQENLLVAPDNNQIRRFDQYGGFLLAVNSAFSLVRGIAVGTDGDIYVSSPSGFNRIDRFAGSNLGYLGVFAPGLPSGAIDDLAFGPDGDLYFPVLQQNQVYRVDGATGTFLGSFASITAPKALTFGPSGDLYVATSGLVHRFDGQSGADLGAVSGFSGADYRDLEFGSDGLLYVSDVGQDRVHRFDVEANQYLGAFVDQGGGPALVAGVWGLQFDSNGDLLVSGISNGVIGRFDGTTGAFLDYFVSTVPGQPVVLQSPTQFVLQCADALDPDCNENGQPDICDIADGTSIDLNSNSIPDDCELDSDGDGRNNAVDLDDDNDGIPDDLDLDPVDSGICEDSDLDGCDDCSVGVDGIGPLPDNDPLNDGTDTDSDGICDFGDVDDDNDGIVDISDPQPLDPSICGDSDADGCDDCAIGVDGFGALSDNDPLNDGVDTDQDGDCDSGDVDDDNDGVLDPSDPQPLDPSICGDADSDGCDDCAVGVDGFGAQADNTPLNDGLDTDSDGLCDFGDPDDDNDGVADTSDPAPQDPSICGDTDLDGCDDCAVGSDGFGSLPDNDPLNDGTDTDSDGICDAGDLDDDNDGVVDTADPQPLDPSICGDSDGDSCDDCAIGTDGFGSLPDNDPANDGADNDGDGACDLSDPDDDNDGVLDGDDNDPFDPTICRDLDGDGCDDCSSGSDAPNNDGLDTDSDGLCDSGDPDDDNDGVIDGGDTQVLDPTQCRDLDGDGCDDCTVGVDGFGPLPDFDTANDGVDTDSDGVCDLSDADDDNDGVPDLDDNAPLNPTVCRDLDGDGCDDCSSGTDAPSNDGLDTDSDGLCDLGDTDDDNDGVLDVADLESANPSLCGDSDGDLCDDCAIGTDGFGPLPDNDPDNDGVDTDADGVCNFSDTDDDNDAVLDVDDDDPLDPTVCRDLDGDGCDDCSSGTDAPNDDGLDTDLDGLCDVGDPDDDNDGVFDGVDPQGLDPDQCGDIDSDGCDDCSIGTDGFGPLPDNDPANDGADNDGDGICDFSDPDDDNDLVADSEDNDPFDPTVCRDLDGDGCDDCSSGTDAPNDDGLDTDSDGLCDTGDSDDDNDGVLDGTDSQPFDPTECEDLDADGCDDCAVGTDGFGPLPDNDPANDGQDTDSDGTCNLTDTDDDNDGVLDVDDDDPLDATVCRDLDGDGCDDCSSGTDAPNADGLDTDSDGMCDFGDADDDNDGVLDGADVERVDPTQCEDLDGDGCDDCAVGTDGFGPMADNDPSEDGLDTDADGLCDFGDLDSDNDGVLDGADPQPLDPSQCGDSDFDGCDDCVIGTDGFGPLSDSDPANDGSDNEGDGLCDFGDPDDDNDGVPDLEDSSPFDPNLCRDLDGDGCDDCSSGTDAPNNDGLDTDLDGLCDSGDPDDDNDGVLDGVDLDPLDPFVCGDANGDGCDDCSGVVCATQFRRGDANGDGSINIADAISALAYLFSGGVAGCLQANDVNNDNAANIADAIALLGFLFSGAAPPQAPFPDCGTDPDLGPLTCDTYRNCP